MSPYQGIWTQFWLVCFSFGADQSNDSCYFQDPLVALNYSMHDYPPDFEFQNDNIWYVTKCIQMAVGFDWNNRYPRAQGLGGCALHNAMINVVAGLKPNFNSLQTTFNDPSWSFDNMWNYWIGIERNLYLSQPNPNHGFDGWLSTIGSPIRPLNSSSKYPSTPLRRV